MEESQLRAYLSVPTISKEEEMGSIEEDVKQEPPRGEELATKPAFTHR